MTASASSPLQPAHKLPEETRIDGPYWKRAAVLLGVGIVAVSLLTPSAAWAKACCEGAASTPSYSFPTAVKGTTLAAPPPEAVSPSCFALIASISKACSQIHPVRMLADHLCHLIRISYKCGAICLCLYPWFWTGDAGLAEFILHFDKHLSAIIAEHGKATYAILFAIVFAETGFVLTPFLPGKFLSLAESIHHHDVDAVCMVIVMLL